MKFPTLLTVFAIAATTVFGQDGVHGFGIISPGEGTSISAGTPLNVTFNPGRYFKEHTRYIDVFIILNHLEAKSGKDGYQLVTGMTPNTQIYQGSLETDAYQVDIDMNSVRNLNFTGEKTVLIKESYTPYQGGDTFAFWAQTFQFTN
ncbi:hypothetical protein PM082_021866 [Marasmius tenuissimus]|nr:hypothetical protein PM082_021866 [Marasmius tenuissimus]